MLLTFAIIFIIISNVFEFILLKRLKQNYPEILKREGNPKFYWNNTDKCSFFIGYIGLRQYKRDKLDTVTQKWCHYNWYLTWVSMGIYCYFVYLIVDKAFYV